MTLTSKPRDHEVMQRLAWSPQMGFRVHLHTCTCRITLELRDRQTKVDVLHAKFQMLASRAHGTDADGGEPKSQAYYIVKVGCDHRKAFSWVQRWLCCGCSMRGPEWTLLGLGKGSCLQH